MSIRDRLGSFTQAGVDPAPRADPSDGAGGETVEPRRQGDDAAPSPFLGDPTSPAGPPTEEYTSASLETEQDARNDSG